MTSRAKAMLPVSKSELVPVDDLVLDRRNPRLLDGSTRLNQDEILQILWREFAVDEIAISIAANGYFLYEPLFVAKEDGQNIVIEGNRRLAAVRLLRSADLRRQVKATDLPEISEARRKDLERLPVVFCEREAVWQYVGFRHLNGPQAWDAYSKAQYVAWVRNELGIDLEEIATHIGDTHLLMVLQQAENEGVFFTDDRWKSHFSFSHLSTGLGYAGIRKFLNLTPAREFTEKPVPSTRVKQLGELCEWLYGSKSKNRPPVVTTQNPDLRKLDEALQSRDGAAALRQGLSLGCVTGHLQRRRGAL